MAEFFDRLEEAIPVPGETFAHFRAECEARERAGRDKFGMGYLTRDNPLEACEEAADGAIYAFLDSLVARRFGLGDADIDLVLMMGYYAYKLYETAHHLRARRLGAP